MTSDSITKTTEYCANVVYQDGRRTLLTTEGYVPMILITTIWKQ